MALIGVVAAPAQQKKKVDSAPGSAIVAAQDRQAEVAKAHDDAYGSGRLRRTNQNKKQGSVKGGIQAWQKKYSGDSFNEIF